MTKKKIIMRTVIITIVLLLLGSVIFYASGVKVAGRCAQYIDEYNGCYLFKKEMHITPFLNFGTGGASGYKVWFLPGQKGKLLKKIKKDVNTKLKKLVANNSDILIKYEISDDFKKIYLYHYKGVKTYLDYDDGAATIEPKVELYHQIIHGYGNVELPYIMEYIEVEETSPLQ